MQDLIEKLRELVALRQQSTPGKWLNEPDIRPSVLVKQIGANDPGGMWLSEYTDFQDRQVQVGVIANIPKHARAQFDSEFIATAGSFDFAALLDALTAPAAVSLTEREAGEGLNANKVADWLLDHGRILFDDVHDGEDAKKVAAFAFAESLIESCATPACSVWQDSPSDEPYCITCLKSVAGAASPTRKGSSEWVPVGERLPEPGIVVWAAFHHPTGYADGRQEVRRAFFRPDGIWDEFLWERITHWQPLYVPEPTPPQP